MSRSRCLRRMELEREIAEHAYETEMGALREKIRVRQRNLEEMSDAEFAQAVREYAESLIREFTSEANDQ